MVDLTMNAQKSATEYNSVKRKDLMRIRTLRLMLAQDPMKFYGIVKGRLVHRHLLTDADGTWEVEGAEATGKKTIGVIISPEIGLSCAIDLTEYMVRLRFCTPGDLDQFLREESLRQ